MNIGIYLKSLLSVFPVEPSVKDDFFICDSGTKDVGTKMTVVENWTRDSSCGPKPCKLNSYW